MAGPSPKFFEGRTPPDLPMFSQDNIDWYAEMKLRSMEGFSFRGEKFTGDQWWFYNMNPMKIAMKNKHGAFDGRFDFAFPYWNQTDDWIFKQLEEARQEKMDSMIMGGRGTGKSYIVLSIGTKIFYLVDHSHGVISASSDNHASETWSKFSESISSVNSAHPSIALNLLIDNAAEIISGDELNEDGEWKKVKHSTMEKIIYDKRAGVTKGRRVDFQHWEEFSDWNSSVTLKECYTASKGTWHVGDIKKARVFYTGTSGTENVKKAKDMFMNPLAYGIYPVSEYKGKKVALFIDASTKFGGYYESGTVDKEGATIAINKLLDQAKLDPDPMVHNKLRQEYPTKIEHMFDMQAGNRFHLEKVMHNLTLMELHPELRKGMWVDLFWKKKDRKIEGVEWKESPSGKIWMLEPPVINKETGMVEPKLYLAGYDGIDIGADETAASTGEGSEGAISVKKRFLPGAGTDNIYVCHYFERPAEVEELYENCYKIAVLYGCLINIEASKVGIVGHFKKAPPHPTGRAYDLLMKRPRITLTDVDAQENNSKLIGTTPTDKNFQYGETFLAKYTKDYGERIFCKPVCEDLRDYTSDTRGQRDKTVSMMMAEIADEELIDQPPGLHKPIVKLEKQFGYYTDEKGVKRYGEIPEKLSAKFNFAQQKLVPDVIVGGQGIYLNQKWEPKKRSE